ncbi:MAG TPA: 5-(carboxyamino)imidazole ribonucleotide synthase [Candidatus Bathyarchaeia archaeon]|nr:5-(carboxyamino)imidazole ribonucleotide synthase [Candidatus Bathyarchaeia archaeon]
MLGGGQLARMTAEAGARLGIPVVVLDAEPASPAGQVTRQIVSPPSDTAALEELAREIDVVTLENEFVDLAALEFLVRRGVMARPSIESFAIVHDKLRQKQHLAGRGLAAPPVAAVTTPEDVARFAARHGWPAVLKTRSQGYDGRGVAVARDPSGVEAAWRLLGGGARPLMVEGHVAFRTELATQVVRNARGEIVVYPVVETVQGNFVCRLVRAPAPLAPETLARASSLAVEAVVAIGGIGVHGVEMFLADDGQIYVNEIAPRPHNSGHYTIDACETSQFENHLRAILGLPLGSPAMRAPAAVMVNLLATRSGPADGLRAAIDALRESPSAGAGRPAANIYLYGKSELRPGRKMGHVNVLGGSISEAEARALEAVAALDL